MRIRQRAARERSRVERSARARIESNPKVATHRKSQVLAELLRDVHLDQVVPTELLRRAAVELAAAIRFGGIQLRARGAGEDDARRGGGGEPERGGAGRGDVVGGLTRVRARAMALDARRRSEGARGDRGHRARASSATSSACGVVTRRERRRDYGAATPPSRRVDARSRTRRRAGGAEDGLLVGVCMTLTLCAYYLSLNSSASALGDAATARAVAARRRRKPTASRSARGRSHSSLSTCTFVIVALYFSLPFARVRTLAFSRSHAPLGLPRYKPESAFALQSGVLPSPFFREIVVSVTIRLIDVRDLRHQRIIWVGVRQ